MSISSLLVQTCEIRRWSPRAAGSDYTLDAVDYATVATNVKCNIQETAGRQLTTPGGGHIVTNAVGYFLFDADVRPSSADASGAGDVVVLESGARFEVLAVVDQVGRQKFKKAFLRTL